MEFDLHAGELVLAENRPLAARHARGALIVCTAGIVWITVAGEAGDIFLHAGQSHRIRSNGLALLEAIGHGSIRIQARARPLLGHWLRDFLRQHPDRLAIRHPPSPA
ncbi:DUF2917 domain-containing protein [Dechloromonas denitrificans]|uniref:DUF2917 domain-containing protein n=1 Tax=Dechloromonas denitrificans TaxID=281362 RepID=UPI001CF7F458|nr:DUF2917 domain-containing protein [Dechloromonas denitrificans]UCV05584.1 DUF2917 domain-containing protein [Dechloromonas denitrificans]